MKHDFYLDERGQRDDWRHDNNWEMCNGPECKRCGQVFCLYAADADEIDGECRPEADDV